MATFLSSSSWEEEGSPVLYKSGPKLQSAENMAGPQSRLHEEHSRFGEGTPQTPRV